MAGAMKPAVSVVPKPNLWHKLNTPLETNKNVPRAPWEKKAENAVSNVAKVGAGLAIPTVGLAAAGALPEDT